MRGDSGSPDAAVAVTVAPLGVEGSDADGRDTRDWFRHITRRWGEAA
jgi:hypothetical protein